MFQLVDFTNGLVLNDLMIFFNVANFKRDEVNVYYIYFLQNMCSGQKGHCETTIYLSCVLDSAGISIFLHRFLIQKSPKFLTKNSFGAAKHTENFATVLRFVGSIPLHKASLISLPPFNLSSKAYKAGPIQRL